MTKKLFGDGITGDVVIHDGGYDIARSQPLNYLNHLYFHSALDYVGVDYIYTGTIYHPQRDVGGQDKHLASNRSPQTGVSEWQLLSFPDRGYIPHGILVVNGEQLPGAGAVQRNGVASSRYIILRMTNTGAFLHERFHTFNDYLPAVNVTYALYVFTGPIAPSGNKALFIRPDQMIATKGKLNTAYRYIRSEAAAPAFRLIRGATADVSGGGLRIVTPLGTVMDDGVYNGGFGGSVSKGVTI